MCIALISTAHPDYPFILANNRDEYLTRPTARASFWEPPHTHVLGGRDLLRPIHGTWLGITKQGRIAVLTNFREEGQDVSGLKSRGEMVNSFLATPPNSGETTQDFTKRLIEQVGVTDVGGFSLVVGQLGPLGDGSETSGLAVVSNRSTDVRDVTRIAQWPGEVHALSNSYFGDLSWPKVVHGEQMLRQTVHSNAARKAGKQVLINSLFEVLSLDVLPRQKDGEAWEAYLYQLRHSIFIPRIGGELVEGRPADAVASADSSARPVTVGQGIYGTQKQTVILVDKNGHVTFVEKTLFDEHCQPLEDSKEVYEFDIEGWGQVPN